MAWWKSGILLILLIQTVYGFYIPGWSIKSYKEGDRVPLNVNKVTSDATQLPYAYYDLPFVCQPSSKVKNMGLNIGEVLRGDRIWGSDYELHQNVGVQCETLCEKKVDKSDLERAHELISENYQVEWIVDNLPGATAFISLDRSKRYYAAGFPLGAVDKETGRAILNNHVTLLLRYRKADREKDRYVIVGFEVYPKSVSTESKMCPGKSDEFDPFVIDTSKESDTIRYTYSVYWREDESISWASRWDMYFSYSEKSNHVHWLAIVNSLVIAAFLAVVVGVILIRTLNRDIQAYKQQQEVGSEEDKDLAEDVSGWKLVYADVFRRPRFSTVLTSLVGSGFQFIVMTITVTIFACIGILNPSYRGGFLSYALFLFAFAGIFSGYINARITKDIDNPRWATSLFLTALIVPASILVIVLVLNMFVWKQSSSSALPFGTVVALFCIWLLISCPLVMIGGLIGHRVKASEIPTRIAAIPRQIPPNRGIGSSLPVAILGGGLLPFLVIFVELMFIFKSIWQDKGGYYYMYGFFALIFLVLTICVMEMSIVMTYFLLSSGDYRWWWRSFMVGTGSAWWIFIYSIYYYITTLKVDGFVSGLLFFGYSLIGCIIYGLITGTIGFMASYFFVRRIYAAIKAD